MGDRRLPKRESPRQKALERAVKKGVKKVEQKVAPAGKRGLVANQQQIQKRGGRQRVRKRQGAGKWAKHGCKVTQDWANAHINWCPWGSWAGWTKKAKLRSVDAAKELGTKKEHADLQAPAEQLHVKDETTAGKEAAAIAEAEDGDDK